MKNRGLAIAITVLTSLFCLCLALVSCLSGGISVYMNGQAGTLDPVGGMPMYVEPFSSTVGYVLVCLSCLFVLTPVVVGILTLRKPKEVPAPVEPGEPLPPAS